MIAESRPDGNAGSGRKHTSQVPQINAERDSQEECLNPHSDAEEAWWAAEYARREPVMQMICAANDQVDWDAILAERKEARDRVFSSMRKLSEPLREPFEKSHLQSRPNNKLTGIFVPSWCVEATENGNQAIILAQLAYWFGVGDGGECRAKIDVDGYRWIYKWNSQAARETGLTNKQVAVAMRALIAKRIVVKGENAEYNRLYRLDPVRIESLRRSENDDE